MKTQTSNQIPNQINNIVISKKIYNVIRSIVDSSIKPDYEWNKPIVVNEVVNEKTVRFVKYKVLPNNVEVKAWEIIIMPAKINKGDSELNANLIIVYDGLGNAIARLIIRNEFTITEQDLSGFKHYILRLEGNEIVAKSLYEFEYYLVSPSEPVPYAKPISLAMFINKLMFYHHKALQVTQNADAAEVNVL
jgi:hypothetical protein